MRTSLALMKKILSLVSFLVINPSSSTINSIVRSWCWDRTCNMGCDRVNDSNIDSINLFMLTVSKFRIKNPYFLRKHDFQVNYNLIL